MGTQTPKVTAAQLIFTGVYLLTLPALFLFLSGDWRWLEGWIFGAWFLTVCSSTIIYLYRKDPALLAERMKPPGAENQKTWDKYFVIFLVLGFFTWFGIMPLDAKRYGWTTGFPQWLKVLGAIALIGSFFLFHRSFTDNTYLSGLVRIQEDRKHRVVSTGVYSFVRHPMYLGAILLFIGTPILVGSKYGVLAGILLSFSVMGRIVGEENMLIEELDGYADYKRKVKYRLIPLIW